MGYRKWKLGLGDSYQNAVARFRIAHLLDAYSRGADGPLALACEQPVDQWDDIVEYRSCGQNMSARHYQVKRQNTTFAGDALDLLFDAASRIIQSNDEYGELEIPRSRRHFRFVVPREDILAGTLGLDQLRILLEKCRTETSASTIVRNDGENIDDGKGRGKQQRDWLKRIKDLVGDDAVCARVLAQTDLRVWSEEGVLVQQSEFIFGQHFDDPGRARLIVDDIIQNVEPEGYLDIELLMEKLRSAGPRLSVQQAHLEVSAGNFLIRPLLASDNLDDIARSVVDGIWAAHGATRLRIGFAPPSTEKVLRLACVRLLLHAGISPVRMTSRDAWRVRCDAEVAGTLGFADLSRALDGGHFEEQAPRCGLPRKLAWSGRDLGVALHRAMDGHFWAIVKEKAACALEAVEQVDVQPTVAYFQGLPDLHDRILKGWWSPEDSVAGIVRAGPRVADPVAQIVACVAVLNESTFATGAASEDGSVGTLGALPVRAIAIEQVSGIIDRVRKGVDIADYSHEVVSRPGITLLRANVDELYDFAEPYGMHETHARAGIQTTTPAGLVLDPEGIVRAAVKHGLSSAEARVLAWCRRRAGHYQASLNSAIAQHQESDAAK